MANFINRIPVDSVADPVGAGKKRYDTVDSVKATHRDTVQKLHCNVLLIK